MRIKQLVSFILLFILLLTFSHPTQGFATSWAYPFVVWKGFIYEISDEYVTNIDKKIGHVTKYSDMDSYRGNFSNSYPKGTKYYSIEDIHTDEAIAIREKNGKYKKAIRSGEYMGGRYDYLGIAKNGVTILLVIAFCIYFVKKRRNK
ncbi:hypothetical protein [Sutcliffiella halmapala]|uniref:hypothetical protein n=1 Tax=Sutcliffiella halmapala TaxID=79882 RepID=UPI0009959AFA|nr:hypothetical protein [Sutcliffiella halmapala]